MCKQPAIEQTSEQSQATVLVDPTNTNEQQEQQQQHTFTIKDVTSNNTPKSAYALYQNRVLDITSFADRHPGGDIILLAAGKDATILVKTYHPKGVPMKVIEKLTVSYE